MDQLDCHNSQLNLAFHVSEIQSVIQIVVRTCMEVLLGMGKDSFYP